MGDPDTHETPLDRASERLSEARDAAAESFADAKASAAETFADAKTSAGQTFADAKAAAGEMAAKVKPRLRGVSHQWAFFVSLVLGAALIAAADTPEATWAIAVYAFSLSALFGVSALYHRVTWTRPEVRRWIRRLDHSMIFLLIAGTTTPFAVLVVDSDFARAALIAVWVAAVIGTIVEVFAVEAPKWVTAIVYLTVGAIAALPFPGMFAEAGIGAAALIATGGALYAAGAVIYAIQRPDPNPAVFGYHEIFHVLVIAAAAAHFAAVAIYALPAG